SRRGGGTMFIRNGARVLLLVGALGLGAGTVRGQITSFPPPPGVAPFFQVAPGLTLQQAAANTAVMGQAFSSFPPWALGVAPSYALGFSPFQRMRGLRANAFASGLIAGIGSTASPYTANLGSYGSPYGLNSYGYGYSPYNPYGYDYSEFGGYLRGSADVIRGQGAFMVSSQQANLLKEQA